MRGRPPADGAGASGPAPDAPTQVPGQIGRPTVFWLGVALITIGVAIHTTDFILARLAIIAGPQSAAPGGNYRMDPAMLVAVVVDLLGFLLATWGLLPR